MSKLDRFKIGNLISGWSKSISGIEDVAHDSNLCSRTRDMNLIVGLTLLRKDMEKAEMWEIRQLYPLRNFEEGFNLDGSEKK